MRRYGAAVVVMAFDEAGQADTVERKVEICSRAYELLTEEVGFPPEDIIFDPNIFAIATGIEEHDNYAVDFIEAARELQAALPAAATCPAASPTCRSRSAATNRCARRSTSVFLYHAIRAGMDMGIVNAGALPLYDDLDAGPARTRRGRRAQSPPAMRTERLLEIAERYKGKKGEKTVEDLRLARQAGAARA